MEYLLSKEKEVWGLMYPGCEFNYEKLDKEWLVVIKVGKFEKGAKLKDSEKDPYKTLDALKRVLERTAIKYFLEQNK